MARLAVTIDYREAYGIDVAALCMTDYMSEFYSDLDTDDETRRAEHRAELHHRAHVGKFAIEHGVQVWERITKAFRSEKVSSFSINGLSPAVLTILPCSLIRSMRN
jgi:hypothetical protein